MTLMPSLHVRDPRRRHRANQIRKRIRPSVTPPVSFQINPELISELTAVSAQKRTMVIQRLSEERGPEFATAVLSAVAAALRKKRNP